LAGSYDIPLYCGDIETPPAHLEEQFDVLVGFFVLHHLFDLEKGMAGAARLLKPGGRMVFLEPNPFNPLYYAQVALTPRMKWRAEKGLTRMRPPILEKTMHKAGLSRFSMRRFGFFHRFSPIILPCMASNDSSKVFHSGVLPSPFSFSGATVSKRRFHVVPFMKNTISDGWFAVRKLWERASATSHLRVAGWAVLSILGIYHAICRGFLVDETWYLRVIQRMLEGETLYRDVYLNVTPLPAYLTVVWIGAFGVEMLAMRMLTVVCFLLTVAVCLRIARLVDIGKKAQGLPVISLCGYAPPGEIGLGAPYSPLAFLFFLCAFSLILKWKEEYPPPPVLPSEGRERKWRSLLLLASAGAIAALSFASKQNIGAIALALTGFVVVAADPRRSLGPIALLGSVFCLTTTALLLPVWFTGGWPQFLDYGFLNKTSYLTYGGISYWGGFWRLLKMISDPGAVDIVRQIGREAMSFFPIAAGMALVFSWRMLRSNRHIWPLWGFLIAGFLCAYPRFDYIHLAMALPPAMIGLLYAWRSFATVFAAWTRYVHAGVAVWVFLWSVYMARDGMHWLLSDHYRLADLPHYRGILAHHAWHEKVRRTAEDIRRYATDDHPFILGAFTGFYYLLTGLKTPTPFDIPMRTSLGLHGT